MVSRDRQIPQTLRITIYFLFESNELQAFINNVRTSLSNYKYSKIYILLGNVIINNSYKRQ